MEEGYSEDRQASFRKFLNGFVGENDSFSALDDPIQFRGSIVGSFRLHVNDVPAEVHDWVQLYLFQRKCPHDLALLLAREVQSRIEAFLPSVVPTLTNGGTESPEEGSYLLDSSLLYREMLSQLNQVCLQLNNSETELAAKSATCRSPPYQTSLVAVKNTRRKMEDRNVVIHDLSALCGLVDGPPQSYYAIFDGHSGAEAANFCSAHLHWNLVQNPKFECDPETALREAFATTEDQFDQRSQREGIKSGCTAVCCLIRDKQFYLAWLGDSQAILVKKGMPVTIMDPHKPERSDEKARVEKMGGCVLHVGTWRVNGVLAVSRALGDFEHKPCVSGEPDINHLQLDGDEDFLVLACDGLWDTLSPNDVTASVYHYISQVNHIDDIAGQVAQQAIERGSTDNVTVIIVFLRDLETLAAQCAVTSFSSESVTNHSSSMLEEISSELESKGLVFENGDGEFNYCFKSETVHASGRENVFQKLGGFAPEQTPISELPTPPIEDLMDAEGMESRKSNSNPFESNDSIEFHDSHAKEIASAILTSALESAALGDSDFTKTGGLCELDSGLQRFTDSAFFSGQVEVNPPLGALAESGNIVEAQKPWVLQVQHSSQFDEVDYLPSSNPFEMDTHGSDAPRKFPEYYVSDKDNVVDPFSSLLDKVDTPQSQDLIVPEEHANVSVGYDLLGDLLGQSNPDAKNETQPSLLLEEDGSEVHDLSPEMLKEAEMELKEVHSVLLQSAEVLASDESYAEALTSMQNRFDDQADKQFDHFGEVPKVEHFHDLSHELQVQNLNPFAESQPEMMGNSEVLSGNLFEPIKTSQQDFLAVFEDVLAPGTPDHASAVVEQLLELNLKESGTTDQQVMEVPETPERVSKLTESVQSPSVDLLASDKIFPSASPGSTVPVQNSLLVDFIAPQMIVPELNDPEAVANLLASDVPPTPEVVLEKIPDGVPEADGVTEDSDSEKDGGWSYVSGKATDSKTDKSTIKKTKPGAVTTTVKRTNGIAKEATKASTLSKTTTVKPAESKLKTKPALSKPATQATLKKTPSDPAKKPATPTLAKSKPSPATTTRVSVGSSKTNTISSSGTVTKEGEVKAVVTKTSTTSRPNATLTKKTTSATARPPSTGGTLAVSAAKTTQSTTTTTKSATMKTNRTVSATTTVRSAAAATTTTRPASSTLGKPPPKPAGAARPATASNTATLSKKPDTNATSKSSTNTLVKVSPARPLSTLTKAQKANAEIKQTKETVNKQLVNQPGTLKNKLNSLATNKSSSKTAGATTTLAKSSTLRTTSKTTKSVTTLSKTVTKTTVQVENQEVQKVLIEGEATHSETEKGALEDNGKESQAVDSGLASPESPVSLQLSLVNGNHKVDAPVAEVTAVFEQVELN